MKIARVAHRSAWIIVGLAGLLLPCITLLLANARVHQARIPEHMVAVRRLEWIERYACRVYGLTRPDPPDPAVVLQEDATEHVTFERLAASLAGLRKDPEFGELLAKNVAAIRELENGPARATASLAGILERSDRLKSAVRVDALLDSTSRASVTWAGVGGGRASDAGKSRPRTLLP